MQAKISLHINLVGVFLASLLCQMSVPALKVLVLHGMSHMYSLSVECFNISRNRLFGQGKGSNSHAYIKRMRPLVDRALAEMKGEVDFRFLDAPHPVDNEKEGFQWWKLPPGR